MRTERIARPQPSVNGGRLACPALLDVAATGTEVGARAWLARRRLGRHAQFVLGLAVRVAGAALARDSVDRAVGEAHRRSVVSRERVAVELLRGRAGVLEQGRVRRLLQVAAGDEVVGVVPRLAVRGLVARSLPGEDRR